MSLSTHSLPEDFAVPRLVERYEPLSDWSSSVAWTVDAVRAARDQQMKGNFRRSAALAEALKTDPSIYGALLNRICPHRAIPREFRAAGERVRKEAVELFGEDGGAVPAAVDADAYEWLVQLGVSVEQVIWTPRSDGSRIDPQLEPWPMRHVWHDPISRTLKTMTREGIQTITHGDGKWVVTTLHSATPWQWGAVKAVALAYAERAYTRRDRQLNAETHGEGKIVGTMPEGMQGGDPAGKAFRRLVEDMRKRRSGGTVPYGSKVEILEAMSAMWQIFSEALKSIDSDIARAYLGTDGTLINEGGNYIKSALLGSVRADIYEGDLTARATALGSGLYRPWSLVNFGRDLGVRMRWAFPDADQDSRTESYARRVESFNTAIEGYRANGFVVDQVLVDRTAEKFGIEAPVLAVVEPGDGEPANDADPDDVTDAAE